MLSDWHWENRLLNDSYLGLGCLTAIAFIVYLRSSTLRDNGQARAPRVKYFFPWIGSAIDMGKNPDAFFKRAVDELGPVFKVMAVGQEMTYITTPELINAVYREGKMLTFHRIRMEASEYAFGISPLVAYSLESCGVFKLHHREFSPKAVVSLHQQYAKNAHHFLFKTFQEFHGKSSPLGAFILPFAYEAGCYTFFGKSFDAKKSYEPFQIFDRNFHLMFMGVPRFLIPAPYKAWDTVTNLFKEYLTAHHNDCIDYITQLEVIAKDGGWSLDDRARILGSELWASQSNAVYAAYWVLALQLQEPEGLTALALETDAARSKWKIDHAEESGVKTHDWILRSSLPLLSSTIQEALRISTSVLSIRQVEEPIDLGGYHFETGERLACFTRAVHLDESIHENPHKFNPRRYLDPQTKFYKGGRAVPNHTMPFGGGISMCEGRHFAQGELKILLALLLTNVTMELDSNSSSRPTYLTSRMGAGLLLPVGDLNVNITKRDV